MIEKTTDSMTARNSNSNFFNLEGKTTMKASILVAAMVACALSAPIVSAQEKSAPAKPAMGMDMDKQMPQMQESMKKMQEQMEKLRATTDPQERQKLMQEHMQTMQEHMKTMRGMGGPMMGMMGGKEGASMTNMEPKQLDEFIQRRMDTTQRMESMPAK